MASTPSDVRAGRHRAHTCGPGYLCVSIVGPTVHREVVPGPPASRRAESDGSRKWTRETAFRLSLWSSENKSGEIGASNMRRSAPCGRVEVVGVSVSDRLPRVGSQLGGTTDGTWMLDELGLPAVVHQVLRVEETSMTTPVEHTEALLTPS